MKYLLKGGFVLDGTGKKPFKSDVLIDGDKIIDISENIVGEFDRVINCANLFVAPGFIDAHSHNDFFCDLEDAVKYFQPFVEQGITTQITGNCGFSPFGIAADSKYKDKVGGGLFAAANPGSFKEFKDAAAKNGLYVNIVPLVGHGTTRISVSGYDPKPLAPEEIAKMLKLLDEAMENGAFGGSFGFMYEPGIYSKKDELFAFAERIAHHGGMLTIHPRACSKVALGYPLVSKPHLEIALDEVVEIAEKTKVKTEYSHLIFVGKTSWKSAEPMLKKFKNLNARGIKIAYDNYSFTYGASVITVVLPPWYMALPKSERKKPFNMFKLKLMTNITKKLLGLDFSDFTVAYIGENYKKYEGKTVSQCAKEENLSDFDMYIKLVDLSDGKGRLYLDKYYDEETIVKLMRDDLSVFMTDAWVEAAGTQNGAAYQGFPYFLKRARDNNIPLEQVVYKMSGAIAERYEIPLRGVIAKGNFADITVFDYERIRVKPEIPDFKPEGIAHVIVNGELVLEDGIFKDTRKGSLVLKAKKTVV